MQRAWHDLRAPHTCLANPHTDQSPNTVVHTVRPHCRLFDLWGVLVYSSAWHSVKAPRVPVFHSHPSVSSVFHSPPSVSSASQNDGQETGIMGAAAATLARFPSWPFPLCRHGRRLRRLHGRQRHEGTQRLRHLRGPSSPRPRLCWLRAGSAVPVPARACLRRTPQGPGLGESHARRLSSPMRTCAHTSFCTAHTRNVHSRLPATPNTRPTSTSASRSSSACACASASPAPRPRCSAARSCNARGFSRPPRHLPLGCLLDATRRVSRRSQKLPTALHSCWRAVPVPAIGSHPRCPAVTRIPPKPQT